MKLPAGNEVAGRRCDFLRFLRIFRGLASADTALNHVRALGLVHYLADSADDLSPFRKSLPF
jgi:hypothetical protein